MTLCLPSPLSSSPCCSENVFGCASYSSLIFLSRSRFASILSSASAFPMRLTCCVSDFIPSEFCVSLFQMSESTPSVAMKFSSHAFSDSLICSQICSLVLCWLQASDICSVSMLHSCAASVFSLLCLPSTVSSSVGVCHTSRALSLVPTLSGSANLIE